MSRGRVLLLTGRPGVGKTTVVKKVAAALRRVRLAGFYTEEVRDRGRRRGFRAVTFDGWRTIIADVDHPGPARVGRYGVDVGAVDELAARTLEAPAEAAVFLIDEVGKMECRSARFVAGMRRLLAGPTPAVVTVGQRGGGYVAEVRDLPGTELWTVTERNRDALPARVLDWLDRQGDPRLRSATGHPAATHAEVASPEETR